MGLLCIPYYFPIRQFLLQKHSICLLQHAYDSSENCPSCYENPYRIYSGIVSYDRFYGILRRQLLFSISFLMIISTTEAFSTAETSSTKSLSISLCTSCVDFLQYLLIAFIMVSVKNFLHYTKIFIADAPKLSCFGSFYDNSIICRSPFLHLYNNFYDRKLCGSNFVHLYIILRWLSLSLSLYATAVTIEVHLCLHAKRSPPLFTFFPSSNSAVSEYVRRRFCRGPRAGRLLP